MQWYSAREYLNTYCSAHIFGLQTQTVVASSLLVSAAVSVNALTNYFADSANIDWTVRRTCQPILHCHFAIIQPSTVHVQNPGGWFSLFNMLVLCALLFLALVALERINSETRKLVKVPQAYKLCAAPLHFAPAWPIYH